MRTMQLQPLPKGIEAVQGRIRINAAYGNLQRLRADVDRRAEPLAGRQGEGTGHDSQQCAEMGTVTDMATRRRDFGICNHEKEDQEACRPNAERAADHRRDAADTGGRGREILLVLPIVENDRCQAERIGEGSNRRIRQARQCDPIGEAQDIEEGSPCSSNRCWASSIDRDRQSVDRRPQYRSHISAAHGNALEDVYASRDFRTIRDRLGLRKCLVLYLTRHEHATELYRVRDDVKAVMDALGHANVQTTMRYAHAQEGKLKQNQQLFDEGLGSVVPANTDDALKQINALLDKRIAELVVAGGNPGLDQAAIVAQRMELQRLDGLLSQLIRSE